MLSHDHLFRLFLFVGLFGVMFAIEGLFPARSWKDLRKNRALFSIKLAAVNNAFMVFVVATPFFWWANFVEKSNFGLSSYLGIRGIYNVVATVILFDFLDGIKHLMFHRVPIMWRFHRVHHTDTHLDIFTSLRYHPGEFAFSAIIKAIWIVVWGPSALAFLTFEVILNVASQFHHSNITFPDFLEKALNKIIVTPRYHAMHHTITRERGDQNFTTVFSLWDRVFKTYTDPFSQPIDLERLGVLQNDHLNLRAVLQSPIKSDSQQILNTSDAAFEELKVVRKELDLKSAILIDVRENSERQKNGIIAEAHTMPWALIRQNEQLLPNFARRFPESTIYLFCAAGVRACKAVEILHRNGIKAKSLGGLLDLTACNEGFPLCYAPVPSEMMLPL